MSARPPKPVTGYSYQRFSDPTQADGDSVRRQDRALIDWLGRHPHVKLDTSLTLRDRGVSAFRGKHRTGDHAMAVFLDLVRRGRIPRGSHLIIENLDRLSREEFEDAVPLVLELIRAGVIIVALRPYEMIYQPGMNESQKLVMVMELSRAHGESKRKSTMLSDSWVSKREDARASKKPMGRQVPYWIACLNDRGEPVRTGEPVAGYALDPIAARTVKRIFQMTIDGISSRDIASRLNQEGVPAIGRAKSWYRTYVHKIVRSRSTLGEFQPLLRDKTPAGPPIEGYFPPVVSLGEFDRANRSLARNRTCGTGRRAPRHQHELSGLLVDALDRCPLYSVDSSKKLRQLVSAHAFDKRPGAAPWRNFPLEHLVRSILSQLVELKGDELFGDPAASKITDLNARVAEVDRLLSRATQKWEEDRENATWERQIDKLDKEKRQLVRELAEATQEAASPVSASWAEAVELMRQNDPGRLRAALSRCIEEILVLVVKMPVRGRWAVCQVHFRGGGRRSYIVQYVPGFKLPQAQAPDRVAVISYAEALADPDKFDLRDQETVREIEKRLAAFDPNSTLAGNITNMRQKLDAEIAATEADLAELHRVRAEMAAKPAKPKRRPRP